MPVMRNTLQPAVLPALSFLFASLLAGCPVAADPAPDEGPGLPEGESTWSGTAEMNSIPLDVTMDITNTGGDLVADVSFENADESPLFELSGTFRLAGTHHPASGKVALAPLEWVDGAQTIEIVGLTAEYDKEASAITGVLVDYATEADNILRGGQFEVTLNEGDGAPSVVGDGGSSLEADRPLPFEGISQCSGGVRQMEAELLYENDGGVDGWILVGDPGTDTPLGQFDVTGVHNPTTGRLVLVPGLWEDVGTTNTLTFFVDGVFDADDGSYVGDQRVNIGACPVDGAAWVTQQTDF